MGFGDYFYHEQTTDHTVSDWGFAGKWLYAQREFGKPRTILQNFSGQIIVSGGYVYAAIHLQARQWILL